MIHQVIFKNSHSQGRRDTSGSRLSGSGLPPARLKRRGATRRTTPKPTPGFGLFSPPSGAAHATLLMTSQLDLPEVDPLVDPTTRNDRLLEEGKV